MKSNQLDFLLSISPNIDRGKFLKQIEQLGREAEFDINFDVKDAIAGFENIEAHYDVLEDMLSEAFELDIDTTEGQAAIERFKESLEDIASGNFDNRQLAESFDKTKREVNKLIDTQTKALAQMRLNGDEGSDAYKKLETELEQSKIKAEDLNKAFQGNVEEIEQVTNQVEELGQANKDTFTDKFMKFQAFAQAAQGLQEFADKGVEVRDAMMQAQAATGATTEEMAKLRDMADEAFTRGVGGSLAESIKTMGIAKKTLGEFLDDKQLTDFTVGAQGLATAMDKDVAEVINKSRTFIANFKLEGQQAFNLMALGAQNAGSAQDDLLDTLDEYSSHLVKAGYTAAESMAIFNNGIEAGVWNTDKLGDAIKETNIRLMEGDVSRELSDAIINYSSQMPSALGKTLNAIVRQGEQGVISTKEVLNSSASAIQTAFDEGKITAQVRDKLARSFSGTMAEDIGGEFWSKAFSADIDINAIQAQAAKAGEAVMNSAGPVTAFESIKKNIEVFAASAAEKLAPVAQVIAGLGTTIAQLSPGIMLLQSNWDVISKGGAKAWGFIKSTVSNAFTGIKTAFAGGAMSATAFWSAATLGIALLLPILITLYNEVDGFRQYIDNLINGDLQTWATTILGFFAMTFAAPLAILYAVSDDFRAKVDEMIGSFVEGIKVSWSYIKGFVGNFGEIISSLAEYIGAYLNPANWFTDDGGKLREKASKRLKAAFAGAVKDAENDIKKRKLGEAMEAAVEIKGDLDKNKKLQGLINEFKNTTDQVKKNSIAKAIQEQVPGAVQGVKTIVDENGNLQKVYDVNVQKAEQFAAAQDKLFSDKLQGNAQAWKNGIIALNDEYEDTKTKLGEVEEQIAKGGANDKLMKEYEELLTKLKEQKAGINDVITQGQGFGLIGKDVNKVSQELGLSGDMAKKLDSNVAQITAEAKGAAKSVASIGGGFSKAEEAASKALTASVSKMKDIIQAYREGKISRQEYNDQISDAKKETQDLQNEADKLSNITTLAEKFRVTQAERIERAARALDVELERKMKSLEMDEEMASINDEIAISMSRRDKTVNDEIIAQQKIIDTLTKKKEIIDTTKGITLEQKRSLEQQRIELADEIKLANASMEKLTFDLVISKESLQKELAQIQRDNRQKVIEFEISLKISDENKLIDLYREDLAKIEEQKKKLNARMLAADAETKFAVMKQLEELAGAEIDIQKSINDAKLALIDRYYSKLQAKQELENAKQERILNAQKELYDDIFTAIADVSATITDEANKAKLDALDAQQKKELAAVEGNEYLKLQIEKKYQELRQQQENSYATQKLINEQIMSGERLAADAEIDAKRLEMQKKALELEQLQALEKGDTDAAMAIEARWQAIDDQLKQKNDVILTSAAILQEGLTDTFANLFEGNDKGAKEGMRKTFATLAGYLKKLLTAWVIEIVLTSKTMKALAAEAGPAAPLVTAGMTALLTVGMNSLLNPILNSLLSFPTGARFDEPTFALIGDGSRLGGENREWLLRDDQFKLVLNMILQKYEDRMLSMFGRLESALSSQKVIGVIKGSDLLLVTDRAANQEQRRVIY